MNQILENKDLFRTIISYLEYKDIFLNIKKVCVSWNNAIVSEESNHIFLNLLQTFNKETIILTERYLTNNDYFQMMSNIKRTQKKYDYIDFKNEDKSPERYFENSLILKHVSESSSDADNQTIEQTLFPNKNTFWSSKGSKSNEVTEFLVYGLKSPKYEVENSTLNIMIIDCIKLRSFCAHWQNNNIYVKTYKNKTRTQTQSK
jgi:hypothetical protein